MTNKIWRLLLVTVFGTFISVALAAKYSNGAAAASLGENENQEASSGGAAMDMTTKGPLDFTDSAYTADYEAEDSTHSNHENTEYGHLGPGAITAISIALILGASVLIALIVITLKKFSAS
ncbi:protein SNORC [Protopterus annectens]|uniref:protein SNORC n=1 Tax=Protopterus annectens TaxID=7888 RepID=UPI001CFC01B3|nr:protein SNORC [Protopterus annectens]